MFGTIFGLCLASWTWFGLLVRLAPTLKWSFNLWLTWVGYGWFGGSWFFLEDFNFILVVPVDCDLHRLRPPLSSLAPHLIGWWSMMTEEKRQMFWPCALGPASRPWLRRSKTLAPLGTTFLATLPMFNSFGWLYLICMVRLLNGYTCCLVVSLVGLCTYPYFLYIVVHEGYALF
jgi:hypothetical protein